MIEVKSNPRKVEKACLVGVQNPDQSEREAEGLLDELAELVRNLGIEVVHRELVRIKERHSRLLIGGGRAATIISEAKRLGCDLIAFDEELSPAQQRNWEQESRLCVIDRQEVILDIFAERAQTKEASLQVELARLEYMLPRLKRAWTHLNRQRGGGATQRDTGETQLELDQRIVRDRIARLKRQLGEVIQHRSVQRKQRLRIPLPTAALVGYTNAGKSSLLNRLTGAQVLVQDKLFATLDPTTRRLNLPCGQTLLVTDTVGFVRKLPHRLVEAFKATLEEAIVADILIHVVDASNPELERHLKTTCDVLDELGADRTKMIMVFNKMDLQPDPFQLAWIKTEFPGACFVSSYTGAGLDTLIDKLEGIINADSRAMELLIPHNRYDLIHRLHQVGAIHHEQAEDEGVHIRGAVPHRMVDAVLPFELSPQAIARRKIG
jgi:GTP-binding protein HflX